MHGAQAPLPSCAAAARRSVEHRLRRATRHGGQTHVTRAQAALSREEAFARLGVSYGASAEAVKRAYRKLALRLHPDVNRSDSEDVAVQNFLAVTAAYNTLQSGGGEASRPWWRYRWENQLKGMKEREAQRRACSAADVEAQPEGHCTTHHHGHVDGTRALEALMEAEVAATKERLSAQLAGLKLRGLRKRRGAGATASSEQPADVAQTHNTPP